MKFHILIIQVSTDDNKKYNEEKLKWNDAKLDKKNKWMENIMDKFDKLSPNKAETNKPQDSTTMVHTNRKVPQLDGGWHQKIGGTWTMKHEISSLKFYKIILKTELKRDTALDLKNFYNHINMCLNAVKNWNKIFYLRTIKPKVTPILINVFYQNVTTLPTFEIIRRTLTWVTHFWWIWKMMPA